MKAVSVQKLEKQENCLFYYYHISAEMRPEVLIFASLNKHFESKNQDLVKAGHF